MADTCSGIYFWSWSTSPSGPPPRPPGWRAAAVHERRLEPVLSLRLNSMVTLVVLFIGCVPSLRRRATTSQPLHTDVVPPPGWGEGKEGGALPLRKKISILTRVEIRLVHLQKIFLLAYGMAGFGEISSESVSKIFLFEI